MRWCVVRRIPNLPNTLFGGASLTVVIALLLCPRLVLACGGELASLPVQAQSPTLTVQTQPDTPLVISSPRIVSSNGQYVDIAYDLTNVSSKPIRAYAVKQELEAGATRLSTFLFINLDLSNKPALDVNCSVTDFDTSELKAGTEEHVSFAVNYVEFVDGTNWGSDSAKLAETSAGQRAAAGAISKQLMRILIESGPTEVMRTIEGGTINNEPPAGSSEGWKEGFRQGWNAIADRLKRAQAKAGLNQLEVELRQLDQKFNGGK
jgi:hypothetical protein